MENLIEQISAVGVVPVVKLDSADDALPLAAALKKGGLCCAEVTFRTDAAEESIRRIAKEYPDFLVAAGTVLTPEQADKAMNAGASFGIVLQYCLFGSLADRFGWRVVALVWVCAMAFAIVCTLFAMRPSQKFERMTPENEK